MDEGAFDEDAVPFATKLRGDVKTKGEIAGWKPFTNESGTLLAHIAGEAKSNFARAFAPKRVDGGWTQRVSGLGHFDTYRLSGRVRSSYALDADYRTEVGFDTTGQQDDPKAPTIVWNAHPKRHGVWESFTTEPIRPATNSISIWLRARSTGAEFPFKADFDDFALRRVCTESPE
jgi:hypothetical protein